MFRYSILIDSLIKAIGHKYIRRVPKGVTKTGATKYAYYYAGQEGHGRGVAHESELIEGSAFAFGEHGKSRYHAHISKVEGDKITVKYDDGAKKGQEETMTKKQFQALVHGEHKEAIKQAQTKAEKQLKDFQAGKEKGVKVKQSTLDKLEQRVKNLDALTTKKEEAPKEKSTPLKDIDAKSVHVPNLKLSKEPANKVMTFLRDILKMSTEPASLREYHHVLLDGESRSLLANTGKTAVLLRDPDSIRLSQNIHWAGFFSNEYTKEIASSEKNTSIDIGVRSEHYTQNSRFSQIFKFLKTLQNNTQISRISINLSSELKNKLQAAINAMGNRADNMIIEIMYPKDGKISVYFKDKLKHTEPELFDTIPYNANTPLVSEPNQKSLSISPHVLSTILPYVQTWHMSADFSRAPFVFEGEDDLSTTIIHVPE